MDDTGFSAYLTRASAPTAEVGLASLHLKDMWGEDARLALHPALPPALALPRLHRILDQDEPMGTGEVEFLLNFIPVLTEYERSAATMRLLTGPVAWASLTWLEADCTLWEMVHGWSLLQDQASWASCVDSFHAAFEEGFGPVCLPAYAYFAILSISTPWDWSPEIEVLTSLAHPWAPGFNRANGPLHELREKRLAQ